MNPDAGIRAVVHLNDGWFYQPRPVPGFEGAAAGEGWEAVRLPHTNVELPLANFDERACQIESSYRLEFACPPLAAGWRAVLCFEGVMAAARVWLNGAEAGSHKGGYTPFEIDATSFVRPGARNLLALAVDSRERADIPPFGNVVDYLTYGGIYREVRLELRPPCRIADLRVETTVLDAEGRPAAEARRLLAEVGLECTGTPADAPARIRAALAAWQPSGEPGAVLGEWTFPVEIDAAGRPSRAVLETPVPSVALWDIDDPRLYVLKLELLDSGSRVLDRVEERIGFRELVFRPDGFFLNGSRRKLRGLNRHQSWPHAGYAMPRNAQRADADLIRCELGCTIVRQSHYPQSTHFLERCDEIGLLVFAETPGWQHIGDEAWQEEVCRNVADLVRRDRNHPSVAIWGVRINESGDCAGLYRRTNALARALDPSRQTGGVRNFMGSEFLEDVYTYNDFVHSGANQALDPADKVAKGRHPYLVSEHNGHMYPTKKTDHEARRVEHAMRHARVLEAMHASDRISGAIGWCLFDYNTHADFGSGDRICHHGVLDMYRLPKLAAAVYASQQDERPVGVVGCGMAAGDHDGAALKEIPVFTNSEEVRAWRGDTYLGAFRPDRKSWPHLPHPPVVIIDQIGDALAKGEGLGAFEAGIVKRFLLAHHRLGRLPFPEAIPMFFVMLKRRWGYTEVYNLFGRYLSGWGGKSKEWRFEGWSGGVKHWEQVRGPGFASRLEVSCDSGTVSEVASWESCRVVARLVDAWGNDLAYARDPARLAIEGPLEVIGPAERSLDGGSVAWWLRTTGASGTAAVRVRCAGFESQPLRIEVKGRG